MGDIITNISNVGFPIVACIIMFKLYYEQMKSHNEEVKKLIESLSKMEAAVSALNELIRGRDLEVIS